MSGPLLVLVGPPASGKTTVGTAVAAARGLAFRDTDRDVEDATGTTIADLFVQHGEAHFRALEQQAVERALGEHGGVLALGGGAVTSTDVRERLVAHGRAGGAVVWLDVDVASAARRVGLSRDRPLLAVNPRAMLRPMLEQRGPLYAEVATHRVATAGRSPEEVVDEVLAVLDPDVPR